jgi:hypothetical protein
MKGNIIEELAMVDNVEGFRVREFMRHQGLDERQAVLLYRRMIVDARAITRVQRDNAETISSLKSKIDFLVRDNEQLKGQIASLRGDSSQAGVLREQLDLEKANGGEHLAEVERLQGKLSDSDQYQVGLKQYWVNQLDQERRWRSEEQFKFSLFEQVLTRLFYGKDLWWDRVSSDAAKLSFNAAVGNEYGLVTAYIRGDHVTVELGPADWARAMDFNGQKQTTLKDFIAEWVQLIIPSLKEQGAFNQPERPSPSRGDQRNSSENAFRPITPVGGRVYGSTFKSVFSDQPMKPRRHVEDK